MRATLNGLSKAGLLAALLHLAPMAASAEGCVIQGGGISFGRLQSSSQRAQQAIGTITLRCDGPEGRVVRVGLGAGNSSRFDRREMSDGARRIRYDLYLDPALDRIFGDDASGGSALSVALPAPGVPVVIPVYAVIARGQQLLPGAYSDQVIVNVDF